MSEQLWRQVIINPDATIRDSISVINEHSLGVALVVDESTRLLGLVTDGDIRRGLLKGATLDCSVQKVMVSKPVVAELGTSKNKLLNIMEANALICLPIVDDNMRLLGVEFLKHLQARPKIDNYVFLMAGGFGTRLKPLTNECPKPLLKIGGKPVLENIIESCRRNGLTKFYISVHYKADMIMNYFGDGSSLGVDIKYIQESSPLGTGGALGLISQINHPLVVMNGDVLTSVDFSQLLSFHINTKADATICVREHELQVPYGVVQTNDYRFVTIVEKPTHHFFINAGLYVLSPQVVNDLRESKRFDMPDLLDQLVMDKKQVVMFPVHEYWLDMGRLDDLKQAELDIYDRFNKG